MSLNPKNDATFSSSMNTTIGVEAKMIKNVAIHDASFKSSNSALFSTKLNEEEFIWIPKNSNSIKKQYLNPNNDGNFRSAVQSQEAQPKKINQEYLILKNDAKF